MVLMGLCLIPFLAIRSITFLQVSAVIPFSWEEMIASDESSSFARLEDKLKFQAITDACSSDRDRQVLTLLMEDLSVREVGTRLGISHVMVLKIRNRIRDNYFRRIGEK